MNITRRIHLNPQSKGNLGKSFEAEFPHCAWLDQLGVQWNGSDLDDRHHTFAGRHKDAVRSYQLGNEQESKTALLSLFPAECSKTPRRFTSLTRFAPRRTRSSWRHWRNCRCSMSCAGRAGRWRGVDSLLPPLFPTDDTESMTNAGRLFLYAGDRVDYVIVHNPAKARGDLFKGSPLERQLAEFGAKTITLSTITLTTLLAAEKAEASAQCGLSFAELSRFEAGHLERLLAGEIQWAMQRMFLNKYDSIAESWFFANGAHSPNQKLPPQRERKIERPQPQLNFWRMIYDGHRL